MQTHQPGDQPLLLLERATEAAEAQAIAREIEKLVGGLSHLALEDAALRHRGPEEKAGFRDVAVLYRLHALGPELERRLTAAGIVLVGLGLSPMIAPFWAILTTTACTVEAPDGETIFRTARRYGIKFHAFRTRQAGARRQYARELPEPPRRSFREWYVRNRGES